MAEESELFLEWEERRDDVPFKVHMVAGSVAGLSEHILLLPLDNVKTHMQTTSRSIREAVRAISLTGVRGFYSGSWVIAAGCVPSHALFFLNYEFFKRRFSTGEEIDILGNMLLGGSSALFHDLIMTPCDMIKQRRQLTMSSYRAVVRDSFRREGLRTFWRSFPVNFVGNLPSAMTTVAANENLRFLYKKYVGALTPMSYFGCGALAGALAAVVTAPFDNIRTRLNTQLFHVETLAKIRDAAKGFIAPDLIKRKLGPNVQKAFSQHTQPNSRACDCNPLSPKNINAERGQVKYPNAICAIKIILKEEGFRGFFKGVTPKIAYQTMSSGVSWTIYEVAKSFLLGSKKLH